MHKDRHTHTHTFECHCTHPHHEWHTCQQPSCAADLKQLPSQALSTLGSGELTAARGQALMLPPPSPSYHTERICWLTKCDYPQPFIMLLVRRVAGRNIWRNQLILSYLGNHGFCFRTTAVQFSATHKPFIPHWQHINTASICWIWMKDPVHYLQEPSAKWSPCLRWTLSVTCVTYVCLVCIWTSIIKSLSAVTAGEGQTVIPCFTTPWADWFFPCWFNAF